MEILEFISRIDDQVKIRGFRIELGEIESVLSKHSDVSQCVVLVKGDGQDKKLVAYVVSEADKELDQASLRSYLKEQLPDYMIPNFFISLDALPLNRNGKIDRKALPEPNESGLIRDNEYVAPRTDMEKDLCDIYCEVLNLNRVGIYNSFFELGGSSISSISLVNKINSRCKLTITYQDLFRCKSVFELLNCCPQQPLCVNNDRKDGITSDVSVMPVVQANHTSYIEYFKVDNKVIVRGSDNIPSAGSVIVALNHAFIHDRIKASRYVEKLISSLDGSPIMLGFSLARWIPFKRILSNTSTLYLTRKNVDKDLCTLNKAIEHLKCGGVVFISPEGKQNRGQLRQGKDGVAYLAKNAECNILPVAIYKEKNASKKGRMKSKLILEFGSIIESETYGDDMKELSRLTDTTMMAIARMMPKGSRGVYEHRFEEAEDEVLV